MNERTSGETIRDTFGDYIENESGKVINTYRFPDPAANPWVRYRQRLLAQQLGNDEPLRIFGPLALALFTLSSGKLFYDLVVHPFRVAGITLLMFIAARAAAKFEDTRYRSP